jgi:type VI secretion system protein
MTVFLTFLKKLAWSFMSIALAGCNLLSQQKERSPHDPEIRLQSIDIALDADANTHTATAVDLLIVYKMDILKTLMKLPAREYYASADQIRRDYPDMMDVWHWELTPGQSIVNYPITLRGDEAAGAVIFADYLTPGDHRIRLGSFEHLHVRLRRNDFCILEQGCPPAAIPGPVNPSDNRSEQPIELHASHAAEQETAQKTKGVQDGSALKPSTPSSAHAPLSTDAVH